ncbi:MAG: M48 family metallopeptidase [Bacteroidales bacterium]|nr:M48 family metallopeptidase [Bacteroidales bacterium]
MEEFIYEDPQLGKVIFKQNPRAKKYIIRIKSNEINVTIPRGGNYSFAERFFRGNRTKIIQELELLKERQQEVYPVDEPTLQAQAKNYLPEKLKSLAITHGFEYRKVKISKSRTRWGSCSSKATINLSFYLILLPKHLIEYVLLHELCHTVEMNHGPDFWKLLDKHTGGKAKELRKELRQYSVKYNL